MRSVLLLLPFLVTTAYFFYANHNIDRGEHGGFEYTVTKCLPILALGAVSLVAFRPPVSPVTTQYTILDKIINFRHPAALAFFLSALGDWLLADRSVSMNHFALGVIPFALAHYLNTKFFAWNLTGGQRYWWIAGLYLLLHSAVLGLATLANVLRRGSVLFQVVTTPYTVVLAWAVLSAISNWYYDPKRNKNPVTLLYMLGYISFLISDSLIIFDEFGSPVRRSQLYVLITYYLAEALFFLSFAMHDFKAKGH